MYTVAPNKVNRLSVKRLIRRLHNLPFKTQVRSSAVIPPDKLLKILESLTIFRISLEPTLHLSICQRMLYTRIGTMCRYSPYASLNRFIESSTVAAENFHPERIVRLASSKTAQTQVTESEHRYQSIWTTDRLCSLS